MTADLFLVKVGVSPGKRGEADEAGAVAAVTAEDAVADVVD